MATNSKQLSDWLVALSPLGNMDNMAPCSFYPFFTHIHIVLPSAFLNFLHHCRSCCDKHKSVGPFYQYLICCNTVTNLKKIDQKRKRAFRALTNSEYHAHSSPLFSQLNMFDIVNVNARQIVKCIYSNASTGISFVITYRPVLLYNRQFFLFLYFIFFSCCKQCCNFM